MLLNNLARIIGKENVSDNDIDLRAYSFDASRFNGEPLGIVWPERIEDVVEIVKICSRYGYNIVPRGAGTGLVGGAVPKRDLVLDFTKMNKIKINVSEKKAIVGPGVVCRFLNKVLAKEGLMFPVMPSSDRVCTIGGMIATNAVGNRAVRFGRTSDWVERLRIVTATGEVIETGDIMDFAGYEGVTGIIVEATIKLTTIFEKTSLTLREFDSVEDMVAAARDTKELPHVIALEFMNKQSSQILGREKYLLLVEYEGDGGEVQDSSEIKDLWKLREEAYPSLAGRGYTLTADPEIPADKLTEFLYWLDEREIPAFGHIGMGIIHPCFNPQDEYLLDEMYSKVLELNGKVSGEHGYGLEKKKYLGVMEKRRIQTLKLLYNRKGIINRGKVV